MDAALILLGILSGFLDLIDWSICVFLAYLFSKLPMVSILKKLEMGVFFFCWRQALIAEEEGQKFAISLKEQAESEYSHCHYFSSLDGTELRLDVEGLFSRENNAKYWGKINWGGEYQADGISTNLITGRIFFQGKTANSFDWKNKLAFMYVLESFQGIFYEELCKYFDSSKQIFDLAKAETLHASYLKVSLFSIAGNWAYWYLFKWNFLKYCALFFVPIDFLILFIKSKFIKS